MDDNFDKIAITFGKVLEITNFHWKRFDLSCGEVCISTRRKKIIDEEVIVTFDNKFYQVGVVEYDRDWTPFDKSFKTDQNENEDDFDYNGEDVEDKMSDDDEESGDEKNLDDDKFPPSVETPVLSVDPPEDGEIVEESSNFRLPVTSSVAMAGKGIVNCEGALNMEVESSHQDNNPQQLVTETLNANTNKPTFTKPICQTSFRPASMIPLPGGDEWPILPDQVNGNNPNTTFERGDLLDKRRKIAAPKSIHTSGLTQSLTPISYQKNENTPIDPPKSAPLFDHNNTTSISEPNATRIGDDSESVSREFSKLIKAGNNVGFQLSKDDPVVMGITKGGDGGHVEAP